MNIGFNPTVDGHNQSIEIHYFDFNADLYNQEIRVSILKEFVPNKNSNHWFTERTTWKRQKTALLYLNKFDFNNILLFFL
jgi:riboflavin kinase/FMN adenylyltransferase